MKTNIMKILHITPSTNGYEEVTLLANRYSQKNHLAVIEKNGEQFFTGGFIIADTPMTRTALDQIPKDFQYEFMSHLRHVPFVKEYFVKEQVKTLFKTIVRHFYIILVFRYTFDKNNPLKTIL